ncbi:hypothetical protein KEM54_001442 [Ascosphaera aggregata]|nr:hypothetical protein KEM54_001442 [Ascosphaera aggregata]
MTASWKAAGLTYNRYLAIASRAVRNSLKEEKRLAAARRGELDLRFSKWEVDHGLCDLPHIGGGLLRSLESECDLPNGKQLDAKNLAEEIAKIGDTPAGNN